MLGSLGEDPGHGPVRDPGVVENRPRGLVAEGLVEGQRTHLGVQLQRAGALSARFGFEGPHQGATDAGAAQGRSHGDALGLGGAVQEAEPGRADGLPVCIGQEVQALRIEAILLLVERYPLLFDEDLEAQGEADLELLGPGDANAKHAESVVQGFDTLGAVNFLGHAVIATAQNDAPAFVLGAMLPDLVAMAGLRFREVAAPEPAAGVALHHRTDAVFHAAQGFAQLARETAKGLVSAGMRRGPARAVAHVGVELMLDGWWVREHGVPASYRPALAEAGAVEPHMVWRGEVESAALTRTCERIAELDLAEGYAEPAFVAERLTRILARRPRLALAPAEQPLVTAWAREARADIDAAAPEILAEVGRGLGMTSWYPPLQ